MSTGFNKPEDELERGNHHHQDVAPPTLTGKNEVTRFVNIIQGCNSFCTFCIVPVYPRSRDIPDVRMILMEVRRLADGGARDHCSSAKTSILYGLDLVDSGNLESGEDGPFVDLLRQVANVPGL
jgi:tRNA-2-methylthio-N6-dimethylallyladenosine synthase